MLIKKVNCKQFGGIQNKSLEFSKGLNKMLEMGVDTFIEVGPGKTLSGFIKRMPTEKEIKISNP